MSSIIMPFSCIRGSYRSSPTSLPSPLSLPAGLLPSLSPVCFHLTSIFLSSPLSDLSFPLMSSFLIPAHTCLCKVNLRISEMAQLVKAPAVQTWWPEFGSQEPMRYWRSVNFVGSLRLDAQRPSKHHIIIATEFKWLPTTCWLVGLDTS